MNPFFSTTTMLAALLLMLTIHARGDDAAWLASQGHLIFHDGFDREEDGNLAKAIRQRLE